MKGVQLRRRAATLKPQSEEATVKATRARSSRRRLRQPSLPLLNGLARYLKHCYFHACRRNVDVALDALDFRRRPAERRPVLRFSDYDRRGSSAVHASCDGLLLLSLPNGTFYICNPATRQWTRLPRLHGFARGLYRHSSSGEYRILYRGWGRFGCYYVRTVTSAKPRCVEAPPIMGSVSTPPVLLHGRLHWAVPVSRSQEKGLVVFDTVAESFRAWRMSCPADGNWPWVNLLEMDGTLGITRTDESSMVLQLWVLQDYETETWSLKYRIQLPIMEVASIGQKCSFFNACSVSKEGDVLFRTDLSRGDLFHCDSKGKLLQKLHWDHVSSHVSGQWFKESLVRHDLFERRDGLRRVSQPRFFSGLSSTFE
ncbi:hypothetical protein PVAP13_1KG196100 [Panicum virgatum]|uniref:F-box associated beta-propeller type 3 domain-containing protein n=1 Tax=Panicum virgatum TaxID=38727 RepID=A0A8T0XK74_PANVG|nr:hypothetical protein PVAP13_1KG196100 [Panicum virgatum]